MDDIASCALTFPTGAAAAADIVVCNTGTFDFAAGTVITTDGAWAGHGSSCLRFFVHRQNTIVSEYI